MSDHDIVMITVDIKSKLIYHSPRKTLLYHKANWNAIRESLFALATEFPRLLTENSDVEYLWLIFKNTMLSLTAMYIPSKKCNKQPQIPWITNYIRKLIKKQNTLYKAYKTSKSTEAYNNFKKLKHLSQTELRNSYWRYINNLILPAEEDSQYPSSQKKLWSHIKNLRRDSTGIASLQSNGNPVTDSFDKAELLNQHFKSVFTNEPATDLPDKGPSPHPIMPEISITCQGIENLLNGLQTHKATGPDAIGATILKATGDIIAPILQIIFQTSLNTGRVPADWNAALVTPVFKKGSRTLPSNYRPVSLTCIISKVFERIIASNIMKHLEENNILNDLQYGFRHGRSCETQLISLVNDLTINYDRSLQTDLIITDFAKAFDVVPHRRLLYKLNWYGIRGTTSQWIQSFLSNRIQRVILENSQSSPIHVTSGVPQGTVLGPVLFLVYINDLPDSICHSTLRLFADDCLLYKTIQSPHDAIDLQEDLLAMQSWEDTWLMKFNISKCFGMRVTQSRKHKVTYDYQLHNFTLNSVDHCKYLGVVLQSNLRWGKHIESITAKANSTLGMMRRNFKKVPTSIKVQIYQTIIRPQLEYASSAWSPWLKQDILELEKVQRRAARFVNNNYWPMASVTEMISTLNWETLENRRQKARLCMMYKAINGLVKISMDHCQPCTLTATRSFHGQNVLPPYCRTDVYKHLFFPATINQWNHLPRNVIESRSLQTFKQQIINQTVPL